MSFHRNAPRYTPLLLTFLSFQMLAKKAVKLYTLFRPVGLHFN